MKVYRATLEEPIVFPESVIITLENLNSINFDKVIYFEVSPLGAMGNEGGILIYMLDSEDSRITFETNATTDQQSYDATLERIDQNSNLFVNYKGGFGNYAYVKKNVQLEIDEKYGCYWFHSQNTKLRVNSSVPGVFLSVIAEMKSDLATKDE